MLQKMQKQLTPEMREKIANIVRADLKEGLGDAFIFDPIVVKAGIDDHFPDAPFEYIRILIIFDGDQKLLRPAWTVGLITRIRPMLEEIGIPYFPVDSFIEKSEWEQYMRKAWEKNLLETA